jgi:hypothetical protein
LIILKALGLITLIIVPGWLAVSLLRGGEGVLDSRSRLFLAAALGTGIVAVSALALALASSYSLPGLVVLVAAVSVVLAAVARKRMLWVRELSLKDILFTLALIAIALIILAPPWRIVFGWSDVGIYPNIAAHIEGEGGVAVHNETAPKVSEEHIDLLYYTKQLSTQPDVYYENQFFAFDDLETGRTYPLFYYLWPCFLAVFASLLGVTEMFWAVTAMGVLALWGIYLLSRRLLGERWAIAAAVLCVVSPLMLYFSRYTTTEMMNLAFFLSGSLCLLAYIKADAAGEGTSLAVTAAFFFTLGFLCRIDFLFILIPLGLAYLAKKVLTGLSTRDYWFCGLVAAGGMISVIIGLLFSNVYFRTLWKGFSRAWDWLLTPLGARVILAVVLAFIFGPRLREGALRLSKARRVWVPLMWAALAAVFIYLYFVRPGSGQTIVDYGFIKAAQGPNYMEESLVRWAWYLSFPGVLLIFIGYGAWFTRRRGFGESSLAFMGLSFTLLYALNMRALPMHILAMRRLVPVIFPLALVMMVYVLKSIMEVAGKRLQGKHRRAWGRGLAAVVCGGLLLYLLLFFVNASLPLIGLKEGGNQVELCAEVAQEVEGGATVIMDYYSGDLFGPPLRCFYGVENVWLKEGTLEQEEGFLGLIDDLLFPDEPLYLLWRPGFYGEEVSLPGGLGVEKVGELVFQEETLEKSFTYRPRRVEYLQDEFWLFRLVETDS